MQLGITRLMRGFMGLVRHGALIGIHSSAEVSVKGTFRFGKQVSIARRSIVLIPHGSTLRLGNGVHVGRDAQISPSESHEIAIGDFTSIQDRCILLGQIDIGANCLFAPNVMMSSGSHRYMEKPAWLIRDQDQLMNDSGHVPLSPRHLPIRVDEDCWIGINSVVMRGVTIGRGSVVGANSVVNDSVPPYSVVAGAPARVVGRRLEFTPPRAISGVNAEDLPYFYSGFDQRRSERSMSKDGLRTRGRFQVALNTRNSRRISVELHIEAPGNLQYQDQRRALRPPRQEVSFSLEGSRDEGLISFQATNEVGRPLAATIARIVVED